MLGGIIEISFVIAAILFTIIWYNTYYKSICRKRNLKNPKIQMALDKEFKILA
jgi:hypothetical protein